MGAYAPIATGILAGQACPGSRGARTGIGQGMVQRREKKIMHAAGIAKTHFVFLWMNVDVDTLRRQFQEQHERRMAAVKKHILESLSHRMRDHPVAYGPAIDKEKLAVGLGAVIARLSHPAVQTNFSPVAG